MFCVVYQLKVKSGREEDFRLAWHAVTKTLLDDYGSLGARLHKSEDGHWIAYAQWANRELWQEGHVFVEERSKQMHVDELLEEFPHTLLKLTLIDDLLVSIGLK